MTRAFALAFALLATAAAAATSPSIDPRPPVERIAKLIEDTYFDPAAAARVAAALRSDLEAGKLDSLRDPRELAAVLTDRLRREDAHFSVTWTPPSEAASAPSPAPAVDGGADARENHGVRRVEVLPGNVGLVELTLLGHFQPDQPLAGSAREVADAALALVARTDALIVDLRDCRGGSPSMVGYLVGHFVAADADVYNTFRSRGPDRYERPTVPIPEPRRLDLPLFVVVSGRTGSGAESLAYTLQVAKRATVVGERTAGGANPGDVYPVGDGLSIFISNGSPVNPITHRNWEGDGVQPDRVVASAQAETAAYELALEAVVAKTSAGLAADEARWSLDALRAARDGKPLDENERARYTGEFGPRAIRDVGGELIYTFDRRPPRRLLRLSEDTFTLDGAPYTRLELERDSSGAVTALVMRQVSGSVARFPRTPPAAGR
jgi:hypothetical protein